MRAEYDAWAVYYDWLHPGLPGEAEFYLREGLARNGPVLELGCGTGRISIALAAAGRRVVGLELSSQMLALCAEKARLAGPLSGKLHLVQADMRRFAFSRPFPTILMPYRTFMHLLTPQDQAACLSRVYENLAPGGTFLFNLWAVRPAQARQALPSRPGRFKLAGRHAIPVEELLLRHYYRGWFVERGHLLEEEHRVEEVNAKGRILRSTVLSMRRTCVPPQELRKLIVASGLKVHSLCGGFSGEPFTAQSREMVWELRKP